MSDIPPPPSKLLIIELAILGATMAAVAYMVATL
jgi:hypothetical protein